MAEQAPDSVAFPAADAESPTASLHAAGARGFDPVRLCYIDALARRAAAQQGNARRLLDARLAQALTAFKQRFELAQGEARERMSAAVLQHPQSAEELRRLFAAGDFKGLRRSAARLEAAASGTSLGALVRRLEQGAAEHLSLPASSSAATVARPELKAIRKFRNTWAKLSVDTQVTQALKQAPKNAGPINSHMLVLRSLAAMRDISPDYLNRFMSYADTLLCLDEGEKDKPAPPKKRKATKTTKK